MFKKGRFHENLKGIVLLSMGRELKLQSITAVEYSRNQYDKNVVVQWGY